MSVRPIPNPYGRVGGSPTVPRGWGGPFVLSGRSTVLFLWTFPSTGGIVNDKCGVHLVFVVPFECESAKVKGQVDFPLLVFPVQSKQEDIVEN